MKKLLKPFAAVLAAMTMSLTACASDNEPDLSNTNSNDMTDMTICITIDGITKNATLVDNSSTHALLDKLKEGEVTYTANDYGSFEKVGSLGFSLPRNDQYITTPPGDIILYQGNNLCLYYARNSWDFTPMGKISYSSDTELREFLKAGKGQITVTLSLPDNASLSKASAEPDPVQKEYYDLSGRKVSEDTKGFVIAKNGNKTTKVFKR